MPLAASSLVCLMLASLGSAGIAPVEAPRPAAQVLLRYRFSEGDTILSRIDHDTTLLATKGLLREKTVSRTRTTQRFAVTSVADDGTATLRLSIDDARMEYAFNDEKPTVFDSREKVLSSPVFAGVAKAVGRDLTEVCVRPNGTIEAVLALLKDDELQAIPGKAGTASYDTSGLFLPLPEQPVAVGHEWSDRFEVPVTVTSRLRQQVAILRQCRLESVENGVATISLKTAPLTPVTDPGQLVQLIQRTATGTVLFDVAAGRIIERTTNVDNTEIGFAGGDSILRAVSTWNERLITTPTAISAR